MELPPHIPSIITITSIKLMTGERLSNLRVRMRNQNQPKKHYKERADYIKQLKVIPRASHQLLLKNMSRSFIEPSEKLLKVENEAVIRRKSCHCNDCG